MKASSPPKFLKGFTLIELLVVIAVVGVLATVVILTINPAELLKQARDSNRISDMNTIKRAIILYLVDVSSAALGTNGTCYVSTPQVPFVAMPGNCSMGGTVYLANASVTLPNLRKVDGNGWIPVNLTAISSGAPLGNLPTDPVNNATNFYSYVGSTTPSNIEIDAKMESVKYASSGAADAESTDGGNVATRYEVGTVAGLVY